MSRLGLFAAIEKMEDWRSKSYERQIVLRWADDDRSLCWIVEGHPEEGRVIFTP